MLGASSTFRLLSDLVHLSFPWCLSGSNFIIERGTPYGEYQPSSELSHPNKLLPLNPTVEQKPSAKTTLKVTDDVKRMV